MLFVPRSHPIEQSTFAYTYQCRKVGFAVTYHYRNEPVGYPATNYVTSTLSFIPEVRRL
jgi:hypothetical protein